MKKLSLPSPPLRVTWLPAGVPRTTNVSLPMSRMRPARRPRATASLHCAQSTLMLSVPRIDLLLASNTVMVCVPFLRRIRPEKTCLPLSDAVKVYLPGSMAPLSELLNFTVPR